jgi:predicted metal-dependent peptidase
VNREKYDYEAFLKKFATRGEVMKVNDDEFDYIFYTYGLQLYKKVPLIEPLEYKEVERIREFVIAIDTSGSTSGSLVQTFIQKTYNILKQQESFFAKINLHIVQCDNQIQECVKITNQDEFDEYMKNMKIHGLGGTDFRPVFAYVDRLIEQHEFQNLKGMIYFTDGEGTFPGKQPDYQVAIVYVEEEYENPEVPVWAIKLVLKPDEIEEERQ